MKISTGMTGGEALARIARREGTSVEQVLKKELAAHRASCGRGALYRADIMPRSGTRFFNGKARYNAQTRRTA